jgi:UDPglucose 6-dehydrogenase
LASPLVIDLRNIYQPQEMAAAGLCYHSIGRPAQRPRPALRALA